LAAASAGAVAPAVGAQTLRRRGVFRNTFQRTPTGVDGICEAQFR
jgi:hypothetical protein